MPGCCRAALAAAWPVLGFSLGGVLFFVPPRHDKVPAHPSGARQLLFIFKGYALDTGRRELRRERVVSKDDLIGAIWNGRIVSESTLASCMNLARTAIGDSGEHQRLIKTLPRKGFRFVGEVREESEPATNVSTNALNLQNKPSIAILAFPHLS